MVRICEASKAPRRIKGLTLRPVEADGPARPASGGSDALRLAGVGLLELPVAHTTPRTFLTASPSPFVLFLL